MLTRIFIAAVIFLSVTTNAQQNNAKMNAFINTLMSKMTLDEKIGQLNLPTPGGGIATGTFDIASTVEVIGVVASNITFPASVGNLIWNCPAQTIMNAGISS